MGQVWYTLGRRIAYGYCILAYYIYVYLTHTHTHTISLSLSLFVYLFIFQVKPYLPSSVQHVLCFEDIQSAGGFTAFAAKAGGISYPFLLHLASIILLPFLHGLLAPILAIIFLLPRHKTRRLNRN